MLRFFLQKKHNQLTRHIRSETTLCAAFFLVQKNDIMLNRLNEEGRLEPQSRYKYGHVVVLPNGTKAAVIRGSQFLNGCFVKYNGVVRFFEDKNLKPFIMA